MFKPNYSSVAYKSPRFFSGNLPAWNNRWIIDKNQVEIHRCMQNRDLFHFGTLLGYQTIFTFQIYYLSIANLSRIISKLNIEHRLMKNVWMDGWMDLKLNIFVWAARVIRHISHSNIKNRSTNEAASLHFLCYTLKTSKFYTEIGINVPLCLSAICFAPY